MEELNKFPLKGLYKILIQQLFHPGRDFEPEKFRKYF